MSGHQFVETLKQILYPKASSLNAGSFDWIFENETVLPFLSWFCNTVGHQNVLSIEEKAEFEELERSGNGVLDGRQLDEAINGLSSIHAENVSLDTLREDIERIRDDLERYKVRKQKLVQSRNRLSLHHTGLAHRYSKLGSAESAARHQFRQVQELCHQVNAENQASIERLVDSVHQLCQLYISNVHSEISDGIEGKIHFLSQMSLEDYHKAEEKYNKELTSFTKKLFFEGIADIAGGELSRYKLLEVSDPTSLLVKGQSHEAFLQDCQELSRLQAIFPKSESDQINAFVEAKCTLIVGQLAEDILLSIQNGTFPKQVQEVSLQLQEVNSALDFARLELGELTKSEIPELLRELAALQSTTVLTGDYCLKLARQDYFTSNQDQVIKYLVQQRARNEFLTMAYEIEARNHRDVHHLLTAVKQVLQARLSSFEERMTLMGDTSLTKAKYDRGTIDTRDIATTCLHRMLVPKDTAERQLFLSYNTMVAAAEALRQSHNTTKAEVVFTEDKYKDTMKLVENEVHQIEGILYAESSTVGGHPIMTPRAVQEAMTELDEMLRKLEAAILDTISDVNNKKKILKKDVLLSKERELFTYFHLHPERLRKTVENLEQRLQAQSIL